MTKILSRIWPEFLTILALLFLVVYAMPAFNAQLSPNVISRLDQIQWSIWAIFLLDFVILFTKSNSKYVFLKTHPIEILTVLVPFLRPLRVVRAVSIGGLLVNRFAISRQFRITMKVVLSSTFLAFVASVQMTLIERSAVGSNIKNMGDSIWWALTTITTVGYGDRFPVTSEGRVLAAFLMLIGISLVGVVTASVAAWFVQISNENRK